MSRPAQSALTASRGAGRAGRILVSALLITWFALPLLPLLLWSFADAWSYPSPLPTAWGFTGIEDASGFGAWPAFARSIALGLAVAAIATPIGALAARALTFGAVPFPRAVSALLLAPIALPPFAAVLGVNVLLLRAFVPPVIGVVLVLVVLAIPYTAFVMRTAYGAYDRGYEDEARLLGASRLQMLRRVHLPMIAPALARAAFLAFLVAWSDYIVTVIVGGGELVTLPLVVAGAAAGLGNDAAVAVMSLAAVVPPVVLLIATLSLGRGRSAARRSRAASVGGPLAPLPPDTPRPAVRPSPQERVSA
ncbi:ABC transporter permease [Microbacterium sp. RU33B]|uniref:ABC transporter permease n=1 Tax=Microbacterium sp. RU33B TaxID=1907390 RepID=UPI000968C035|nr:ABC transporter permease subunit [Microbacterium sp. RU33B]SIT67145.1 putative spermidine/putrescine transport system permease protein [Microbacterium sp. RU33B]